jgi:MFS family permease
MCSPSAPMSFSWWGPRSDFFTTGLSTFGVALLCDRFQIGQAVATLLIYILGVGALIGVLSSGRIADCLTLRGHLNGRIVVGGAAFLVAAVFILPTLLMDSLALAMAFAFLAAIGLGSVNPPLNAARLDIVHSRVWGTAEAVRTALVSISTGLAPLVFGIVSTQLGDSTADVGSAAEVAPSAATALGHTSCPPRSSPAPDTTRCPCRPRRPSASPAARLPWRCWNYPSPDQVVTRNVISPVISGLQRCAWLRIGAAVHGHQPSVSTRSRVST